MSRIFHISASHMPWELRQAASRAAERRCHEPSLHVTGKFDQLRGPWNGNWFTIHPQIGLLLTHLSRLLQLHGHLALLELKAWAALELQRGAKVPCHFLFCRLCLQTLAPTPHNYFFTFFNIVTHGWACGMGTK